MGLIVFVIGVCYTTKLMIGKGYRIDFRDVAVWKRYLQDHGFVVLANYLNSEECQQAMQ